MSTFAHAMRRVIRRGGDAPASEAAAAGGQAAPIVPSDLSVGPTTSGCSTR